MPVDTLGCLHRKSCVLHARLHQQGCPHHLLIHQEMVLHEGQGFIRGGAHGALKGEGDASGQRCLPQARHGLSPHTPVRPAGPPSRRRSSQEALEALGLPGIPGSAHRPAYQQLAVRRRKARTRRVIRTVHDISKNSGNVRSCRSPVLGACARGAWQPQAVGRGRCTHVSRPRLAQHKPWHTVGAQ